MPMMEKGRKNREWRGNKGIGVRDRSERRREVIKQARDRGREKKIEDGEGDRVGEREKGKHVSEGSVADCHRDS